MNTSSILKPLGAAFLAAVISTATVRAQQPIDLGELHGNFQADAQYYRPDTVIGAPPFPEEVGSNSFLNLIYTRGRIEAGVRYEAYLPALQGFTRKQGSGVPYRYARYRYDKLDVTAGTFYEQFGSGMVLRAYEEWGLGFDNSIDGARVKSNPVKGLYLTGLIGRQRNAFENKLDNLSDGIIRGADAEWDINSSFAALDTAKTRIKVGGSFVSRYQKDTDPVQIYPENVGCYGIRFNLQRGGFSLNSEYAHKINDPSSVNNVIYKPGQALLVQGSYSQKGLGITLEFKRIDNMDFRSDRSATFNNLTLNFLPPQTKQHTYRLPTLFPWASQPLGEWAMQGEVLYKFKKDTKIGGPYGMTVALNVSRINALDKQVSIDPFEGYSAPFLGKMDSVFFQDINLEISRKFSKNLKASLSLLHFTYDASLFHQLTGFDASETVQADVQVLDVSHKLSGKHNLRWELQHCLTQQEFGSWAMALVEYTFAPKFFVAVFDEYNYGNADEDKQLHYFTGTAGMNIDNYRIQLGYGRQRAGVLCVGGVCRVVPASNGVTLSISGSF